MTAPSSLGAIPRRPLHLAARSGARARKILVDFRNRQCAVDRRKLDGTAVVLALRERSTYPRSLLPSARHEPDYAQPHGRTPRRRSCDDARQLKPPSRGDPIARVADGPGGAPVSQSRSIEEGARERGPGEGFGFGSGRGSGGAWGKAEPGPRSRAPRNRSRQEAGYVGWGRASALGDRS